MKETEAIGHLRHQVTFERPDGPTITQDSFGQVIPNWIAVATTKAKVAGVYGGEMWYGRQVQADVTHLVFVRYNKDIHLNGPRWRINHRGRILAIKSAIDLNEARRFLMISAIEQV